MSTGSETSAIPNHAGWDPRIELEAGVAMPLVGAGTQFGFSEDGNNRGRAEASARYVERALRAGFRLLDTARGYGTEEFVMQGITASGIDRREVFLVSKAWPGSDHEAGPVSSRAAIRESAARLGGYVDLFLVHQPVAGWQDLWRALEEAKDEGVVRAIGVSNFGLEHLEEMQGFVRHRPVANQIQLHPLLYPQRADVVHACQQNGVQIIGFPRSPWRLGAGSAIDAIAADCGRTRAQVMLRWAVDHGCAVIPLSTDDQHLADNFAIREFELTPEQVVAIDQVGLRPQVHYHVDQLDRDGVAGWAFASGGVVRIQIFVDDVVVGEARHGGLRPDVRDAYSHVPESFASGFAFRFPKGCFADGGCKVRLAFELPSGERTETEDLVVSSSLHDS